MNETNYIERYWRDAKPEDAIKEPPMVARFKYEESGKWKIELLLGFDRDGSVTTWSGQSRRVKFCQVYDAPDPGEGWRLIDIDNEKPQDGDEYFFRGFWRYRNETNDFIQKYHYRRRIAPAVIYVPFTWEDREQLRGRWIARDNQELHLVNLDNSGGFCANGVDVKSLCKSWRFLDTGKPVGKEVT